MHEAWGPRRPLNIAVGGPQGVGKSTVLRLLKRERPEFEVVSVGDQLPANFKRLSPSERAQARTVAGHVVLQRLTNSDGGVVLVDLHYLDMDEPIPYVQPRELLDRFTHCVLLIASASTVQRRRRADQQRTNRSVELDDAERDVQAHIAYFQQTALAARALVVDCEGEPATVVADLLDHIDLWRRGQTINRVGASSLTTDHPGHEDRAPRA